LGYSDQSDEESESIRNMLEWKGRMEIATNFGFDVSMCLQLKMNV
jgi:hypothetical protein